MAVDTKTRQEPKTTLQTMEIHSAWSRGYRTQENDRFYQLAFDRVSELLGPPGSTPVVDAGCGSAVKCIALAKRGYRVRGLDFSDVILKEAQIAATNAGVAERIEFEVGDLTNLRIPSGTVQQVLCWGVLMHVPDIQAAVTNLVRILAPGGRLVVSEGNFRSMEARTLLGLRKLLGRRSAKGTRTAAGIEYWEQTSSGKLMTRQADIPWLIAEFERQGLKLRERRAGQFTEIYTVLPFRPLRLVVHAINNFWFRWIGLGGPAFGNMLAFEKPGVTSSR